MHEACQTHIADPVGKNLLRHKDLLANSERDPGGGSIAFSVAFWRKELRSATYVTEKSGLVDCVSVL